jgi:transcriptional regulator with XRE-family HTH domain/sRNA-binding regulator protein Hfq
MALDLWQIRRRKKMTIDDLAARADINPGLIKAYELGQRPIPASDLEKLARALLVEPWEIKELSDPPPRGPSRASETPTRFAGEPAAPRFGYDNDTPPRYNRDSGPARYGGESGPARYGGESGSARYGGESGSSRYGGESGSARYGGESGSARYGGESGSARYGGESGSARYGGESGSSRYGGESGSSRYGGESGSARYGGESGSARYGGESGYSRYGSDQGGGSYGRQGGSARYGGGDRYSSYDDEGRGAPRSPRPAGRPYDDPRRMDRQRAPKKPRTPRRQPSSPARQSQIDHLKALLVKLDISGDELLRLAGKPLSMLTRKEAAKLLGTCQAMLADHKPPRSKGKRQRPYLPESVDEHELVYLTEVQVDERPMRLTLFNGEKIQGLLLGFSPYALTITQPDNQEITVQKLAVAYYEVEGSASSADDEESDE